MDEQAIERAARALYERHRSFTTIGRDIAGTHARITIPLAWSDIAEWRRAILIQDARAVLASFDKET